MVGKNKNCNKRSIYGPRHETTLKPQPCATESRDLINTSSQFVHSAASRPKQWLRFAVSTWKWTISRFLSTLDFLHFLSHWVEANCRKNGKTIPWKSDKRAFKSTMTWAHAKLKRQGCRYFTWNLKRQANVCCFIYVNAVLKLSNRSLALVKPNKDRDLQFMLANIWS